MDVYHKTQPLCPLIVESGIKNIVVSGCSFTSSRYNHSWPVILRDSIGAECVYDFSLMGAGNYHIFTSLIWGLDTQDISPDDSLVVVMWSGNDRDDCIVDRNNLINEYSDDFNYSETVSSGISGGEFDMATSNVFPPLDIKKIKSRNSRAVENYIYINSAWHYLRSRGFKTVFTEFTDRKTPSRSCDFDIKPYLPETCRENLTRIMAQDLQDIYTWCLRRDELATDDFHPSGRGHRTWTQNVLVPWLKQNKLVPSSIG